MGLVIIRRFWSRPGMGEPITKKENCYNVDPEGHEIKSKSSWAKHLLGIVGSYTNICFAAAFTTAKRTLGLYLKWL